MHDQCSRVVTALGGSGPRFAACSALGWPEEVFAVVAAEEESEAVQVIAEVVESVGRIRRRGTTEQPLALRNDLEGQGPSRSRWMALEVRRAQGWERRRAAGSCSAVMRAEVSSPRRT